MTDTTSKPSTTSSSGRVFEVRKAVRESVPVWIGLGGASGGGKTLSALRIATGIQKIVGGRISLIDTEAERSTVYAPKKGDTARPPDTFDFDLVPFSEPFGSLEYLNALRQCHERGSRVVIVDSWSHEHESSGGLLEQFEEELERLSKGDEAKAERVKMLAWKKPKAGRRRMINGALAMKIFVIGCFRTKNAIKLKKGEDPKRIGEVPVSGDGFIYEFPLRLLVKAGSEGRPTLESKEEGEREWIRVPGFFKHLVSANSQLDERLGEEIAKWASGTVDESHPYVRLGRAIVVARTTAELKPIKDELAVIREKKSIPPGEFRALAESLKERATLLAGIEASIEKESQYDNDTGEVEPEKVAS
jgi:hypothetical protein